MLILLTIVGIIVAIIVVIMIIALFTNKGYKISREVIINKPVNDVFNYVKYLKNQDYFNKWTMMDPAMKKEFKGTDGAIGFVYKWEGNKRAGAGEQELMGLQNNKQVDIEVRFIRPFAGISQTPFYLESLAGNQTKLTWGISSTMKYPMNAMLLFMNMDNLLGKDMETSLQLLKTLLEKN
ncbi:MAG: SRPBCC family protein [Chitinophagaceae bacterium]